MKKKKKKERKEKRRGGIRGCFDGLRRKGKDKFLSPPLGKTKGSK